MDIDFPVTETVLFTGAGFTHNFGGLLAKTMWSEIHNRTQKYNLPRLNEIVKSTYDYEELYNKVVNGDDYNSEEKNALITSVYDAYDTLDGVVRYYSERFQNTTNVDIDALSEFILAFAGIGRQRGFFFTINQDLFIERYFVGSGVDRPICPGVRVDDLRFSNYSKRGKDLTGEDYATLPATDDLPAIARELNNLTRILYIKLHGSYDWRDADNHRKLIIGTEKEHDIKMEPILSFNYDLFKSVLAKPARRMLIIGYGFRDTHINGIIANSIKENNLSLYIVSPTDPDKFKEYILNGAGEHRDLFWGHTKGYYPYVLADIFPHGHPKSKHLRNIYRDLFE